MANYLINTCIEYLTADVAPPPPAWPTTESGTQNTVSFVCIPLIIRVLETHDRY